MKYTAVILILLGMTSAAKIESSSLAQIKSTQQSLIDVQSDSESSHEDSDSNDDETNIQLSVQGDNGIIDATTDPKGKCTERLWISAEQMGWEMDQFSRNFDIKHYKNAMKIAGKLGIRPPRVHTYDLMDNAFEWKRVRLYEEVQENLETLEHFEDDLNMNIHS